MEIFLLYATIIIHRTLMVDARAFCKKIFFGGIFMNNNQKHLFSIGEIAKAVGITRKIILNYEAKDLI